MTSDPGFFSSLSSLNRTALGAFIAAKLCGMVGVGLGFSEDYRTLGGVFLTSAFVFIGVSVGCAMVQSVRDRKKFSLEDEELGRVRRLAETKDRIEREIRDLESRRLALQLLTVRRR